MLVNYNVSKNRNSKIKFNICMDPRVEFVKFWIRVQLYFGYGFGKVNICMDPRVEFVKFVQNVNSIFV